MINIDTSDRKEQRKFGVVMAVAFVLLGVLRMGVHYVRFGETGGYPWILAYIAAPFLVLGMFTPGLLRPVFVAWMKFALAINWIVTRVALTVVFFALIVPTRGILILLRKDPLNRAWAPEAESYWEEPEEQPEGLDRYRNQF